jgi:hypothetical protein
MIQAAERRKAIQKIRMKKIEVPPYIYIYMVPPYIVYICIYIYLYIYTLIH